MAQPRTASHAAEAQSGSVAFNLSAMLMLALLVAIGAAYVVDREIRQSRPAPDAALSSTVTRTLSGRTLDIPANWLSHGAETPNAFASQVDLSLSITLDGLEGYQAIDIVLMPDSQIRSGAAMLDTVYINQFVEKTIFGVPGLVGKPLRPGSGIDGETVWYDPLAANPFVAKCLEPIAGDQSAQCLRALVLPSGIGAVVTFEDDALAAWRRFDAEILRLLETIGAL